jgi:hypothetical protein
MDYGRVGDRIVMESESMSQPPREGVIVEVLGAGDGTHYTVKWEDGHRTTFFPTFGTTRIIRASRPAASKAC